MSERATNPELWTAPEWHPDLGDPERELSLLREFARLVLERLPRLFEAELDAYEPGYMRVVFTKSGGQDEPFATLQVVEGPGGARYALFLEGGADNEHYFTAPEQGLEYFIPPVQTVRVGRSMPTGGTSTS